MRAAVVQRTVAATGVLRLRVSRPPAPCDWHCQSPGRSLFSRAGSFLLRQPHQVFLRHASTAPTSAATPTGADSTGAEESGHAAGGSEEVELERLQALIKDKLAKQKQRLLEQLSPLPGEQTSGFKRRTRAQREAERAAATPSAPTATADSGDSRQAEPSEQNEQTWQQQASPLPLRKPTRLQPIAFSTSSATPQQRRTSTPHSDSRSSSRTDEQPEQSRTASTDGDDEPQYTRRTRHNDPNLNPERQAMLHERNARRDEQKRVKVQRRLARDETERVARGDDELFHDVTSPRQKVRGKGIAGSTVLAKHQRHPKGVRDDDETRLATTGSVEERMGRSVFAADSRAASSADGEHAERDRHRRQLKYAERGERGSRQDWAGAGKPGRWEAREQRWQSGRKAGRVRRVGQEHVDAERPRGHGVAAHPWGRSQVKPDTPIAPARSRTYSREEASRPAQRRDAGKPKDQFSWLSDMKQHASNVQQDRDERTAKRDRGKGRR